MPASVCAQRVASSDRHLRTCIFKVPNLKAFGCWYFRPTGGSRCAKINKSESFPTNHLIERRKTERNWQTTFMWTSMWTKITERIRCQFHIVYKDFRTLFNSSSIWLGVEFELLTSNWEYQITATLQMKRGKWLRKLVRREALHF